MRRTISEIESNVVNYDFSARALRASRYRVLGGMGVVLQELGNEFDIEPGEGRLFFRGADPNPQWRSRRAIHAVSWGGERVFLATPENGPCPGVAQSAAGVPILLSAICSPF